MAQDHLVCALVNLADGTVVSTPLAIFDEESEARKFVEQHFGPLEELLSRRVDGSPLVVAQVLQKIGISGFSAQVLSMEVRQKRLVIVPPPVSLVRGP